MGGLVCVFLFVGCCGAFGLLGIAAVVENISCMEGMMMTVVAAATPSPAAVVVAAAPAVPVFKQPQPVNPNSLPFFSRISEDILVNVFSRLEDDPRDLAKLACVCRRFTNVIRTSCWRHQCMRVVPTIVSELMQSSSQPELLGEPPCGWGSLQKLLVCCPGLRHAGVLLEFGDYGLEREIGKSTDYKIVRKEKLGEDPTNAPAPLLPGVGAAAATSDDVKDVDPKVIVHGKPESEEKMELILGLQGSEMMMEKIKKKKAAEISGLEASESAAAIVVGSGALCLHEDSGSKNKALGGDCSDAENLLSLPKRRKTEGNREGPVKQMKKGGLHYHNKMMKDSRIVGSYGRHVAAAGEEGGGGGVVLRTQRSLEWHHLPRDNCGDENSARMMTIDIDMNCKHEDPHLAKGIRILTREQGNKLLASRSVIHFVLLLYLSSCILLILFFFTFLSVLRIPLSFGTFILILIMQEGSLAKHLSISEFHQLPSLLHTKSQVPSNSYIGCILGFPTCQGSGYACMYVYPQYSIESVLGNER